MSIFAFPLPYIITFLAMAFVLGAVIGSFLNVVILRTPLKQSIVVNRSHCWTCGEQLKNIDLIPILSYIFLGGKCRFCKSKISPRYWIVELITAIMFALSVVAFGISYETLISFVLIAALIVASGIDIDYMDIPYGASICIALLGIIALIISIVTGSATWYEHLIGAVIVSVPFAVLALFGAMGGGDVHLMAAAGLLLGWKIVPAAAIGIILGAIGGSISLLSVPKGTKKAITEKTKKIAEEWYEDQRTNGINVIENKTDAIYGSIFKGKSDIEKDCIDPKIWNKTPDIEALNEKLNAELSDITKFAITIVIENDRIKDVTAKKQIVFGPYLSLGIATAYLFGDELISYYLGLF